MKLCCIISQGTTDWWLLLCTDCINSPYFDRQYVQRARLPAPYLPAHHIFPLIIYRWNLPVILTFSLFSLLPEYCYDSLSVSNLCLAGAYSSTFPPFCYLHLYSQLVPTLTAQVKVPLLIEVFIHYPNWI